MSDPCRTSGEPIMTQQTLRSKAFAEGTSLVNRIAHYCFATALLAGAAQAAPLLSTNATTTFHRMQVDGVEIFYREAGPENAPTIVLLHGFPSSSREFDTLIPLLATRYHLIAPDYPGFGLSEAPSPVAYTYSFDHLAETMSHLLRKLGVRHYTMYLHDYGAPIGFRIILAHPDRLHALIFKTAISIPRASEPSGPRSRNTGQIQKPILRCLIHCSRSKLPSSGTSPARPIRTATIRILGSPSMPICHVPVSARSRATFFTIIGPTLRPTQSGKRGCGIISHRPSWPGASTTHRSSRLERRPSGAIFQTRRFTCSTPGTLRLMKRMTRLQTRSSDSWPNIRMRGHE